MKKDQTNMTELEEYQEFVRSTATDKPPDMLAWSLSGLSAEAGEVQGVLEKAWRKRGHLDANDIDKLFDELGDVLWFLTAACNTLGFSLDDVIMHNIDKLNKRKAQGALMSREKTNDEAS